MTFVTFVVEEAEFGQDEPLPLPKTHPGAILQGGHERKAEAESNRDNEQVGQIACPRSVDQRD